MPKGEHDAQRIVQDLKFPRIHHLFDASSHTGDDILLVPESQQEFLRQFNTPDGVATEKIDGSNIGISFTPNGQLHLRHRGGPCNETDIIYREAYRWTESKRDMLEGVLGVDAILFIEWLEFNRGHVDYDDLASFAVAIALFDGKEPGKGRFMSHSFLESTLKGSGIETVRIVNIAKPIVRAEDCENAITGSHYSTRSHMEGLILRVDRGDYNEGIVKFVSPTFTHSIEGVDHWRKKPLMRNWINFEKQAELLGE